MKLPNKVLASLASGGEAFGTFIQLNSAETCEIAARSGMDFVIPGPPEWRWARCSRTRELPD